MHRVYFIGAGPGDPGLLTLKGAHLLARSRSVFAPTPFEETFAEHLRGKSLYVPFEFSFRELIARIEDLLLQGDVAFLVPGDLTFYSPFQGVFDALGDRALIVPGVGTANDASARLRKTLNLSGAANRVILTSPRVLADEDGAPALRELAAPGATLLLYMNHLPLAELVFELRTGFGKNVPIALLHRLGLSGEAIVCGTLDDIVERMGDRDFFHRTGKSPSLTLVIAGETLDSTVDPSWWDWRWENIWNFRDG
jgi:precorrin-4/cobalt-precorrin-4 C11-methyltransferase